MIEVGSRVSRGQTVVVIGDLENYSVKANVDEIDVAKVRVGQAVRVTGDAFDGMVLNGKITSVAGQASGDNSTRTGLPTFPVTVQIADVTPEQRAKIYIGMSANLSIIADENDDAIVVPLNALHEEDGKRTVNVRVGAVVKAVPVSLGLSTPDGVEIRSGLKSGDVVMLTE
jgi:multidrug efflux pump subunit AcrA (membrane-fusion protein)